MSSTGDLYFTTFGINEFGPDPTAVYSTGKFSAPGSEGLLYLESGDRSGFYYFAQVVWANPGSLFGYFIANYNDFGVLTSQIKRVPLAGGSAIVLAQSPAYIGSRDLAADGLTLFWIDAGGIRSMSINGGPIQTLVSSSTVSHIGLGPTYLYYSEGAEISKVPKAGGAATTLKFTPNPVTALYVHPSSLPLVFWGEQGGAVRNTDDGFFRPVSTWQSAAAGRDVMSVGFDGNRVLWIDCTQPGNSQCNVRTQRWGGASAVTNNIDAGVGSGNLQWDATSMYWTSVGGIYRYINGN